MIRIADKLCRAKRLGFASAFLRPPALAAPPPSRAFSNNSGLDISLNVNPIALQMTKYAISLARSQMSDDAYAQAQLVLEQCYSIHSDKSARGVVLLAMARLLYHRGNYEDAIEKLQIIQDSSLSSIIVRVAAAEALVGLHLELGQDDAATEAADMCLQFLESMKLDIESEGLEVLGDHSKAFKGLVELIRGNAESGTLTMLRRC